MKLFWFGREDVSFSGFCQTAARRTAIVLPVAITFSSSLTIALTYLMSFLWLFGGHWKERRALVRSSGILLSSIPLILWTGIGILRYENSFWDSCRYWLGHYPYIFIIVLATLLVKKEDRNTILSSINLALLLCCLWAIGFYLYHQNLSPGQFAHLRSHSIYLYRNSICFGVALTFWGGLWTCLPYTSRHIGWVRKILPSSVLDAMEAAASRSPLDFLSVRVQPSIPKLPLFSLADFLVLLRWGIVFFIVFYLFSSGMPSRTAQLAVLGGTTTLLLLWNRKKGTIVILLIILPLVFLAGSLSKKTPKKINKTIRHVQQMFRSLSDLKETEDFISKNRDRLGIQMSLFSDLLEYPLVGQGMERAREITLRKTKYVDPHNEFFYMMLQHGIIGFACFLFWIMTPFVRSRHLPTPWNYFGVFLAVIVTINCLFNNAMSYHRETFLLCIGFALLASMEYQIAQKEYSSLKRKNDDDLSYPAGRSVLVDTDTASK